MNEHALRVLEYEAVRARLIAQASCSLGRERAAEMAPSTREDEIARWQAETAAGVRVLELPGTVPFGGIHDVRPAIKAASVGGTLDEHALLAVTDTTAAGRKLKAHLLQREEQAPPLAEVARRVGEFGGLEAAISGCIDEHAQVKDDASPALARLRKELRAIRGRMQERLQSILRSPVYRDMLQDPVVTTREGRFCLPVKSECRAQFGGLVHDQSASGATVFMEPATVVELGNELRQVEVREQQEVERILRELSAQVGAQAEGLWDTVIALGELDFIFARGKLALAMDAAEPRINREGFVGLRRARHPLLGEDVVPIDIELGREHSVLIITGPNTGGKTVSLKTVGLLSLMAQSGLHVPAHEGATMPVFQGIYADIGDEQSIQQSLSTFSGHITNIARILGQIEGLAAEAARWRRSGSGEPPPFCLVLLDEVGAGTDPTEGAGLAKAILQHLLATGARVIATTHYGELKEFAYSTPGVENASVEFDLETLRPTYRLLTGIPGTSNAFAIAERLGLSKQVVDAARSLVGTDRTQLSDVIQRLTENQLRSESERRKATEGTLEIERKRDLLDRELRQLRADRAQILTRARAEADDALRAARREIEHFRRELRDLEKAARDAAEGAATGAPGATGSDLAAVQRMRDRLRELSVGIEQKEGRRPGPEPVEAEPEREPFTEDAPPQIGEPVWVAGLGQRGTLLGLSDGKAQVQVGALRMTVALSELRRTQIAAPEASAKPVPQPPAGPRVGDARLRARANISPEIHLRGLRADEAVDRLDSYLDEACLAGLSPIRIVHGKGTGALRKAVWEQLKSHPNIAAFRHPTDEEGGSGVTVAELKE